MAARSIAMTATRAPLAGLATLGANTFTGAQVAPSLALGGATLGSNALAVTGTARFSGNVNLGAADAATPVAQTLAVQSVLAGTANTAGANWTFAGSQSTGNAAGGSIIFQTAPAGVAGSAVNALTAALTITSTGLYQFGGTTSSFPAWKRASATLQARLADDSGAAFIRAAGLTVDSGTNLIASSTAFANGAAAAAGTLTNAPAAGNPTKWIPISDNGTTRYIPAW